MPVIRTMRTSKVAGQPYFPLVESPGFLYLIQSKKDLQSTVSNAILSSISKSWPIMVFVYLAAAVSGIVVWALVGFKQCLYYFNNFVIIYHIKYSTSVGLLINYLLMDQIKTLPLLCATKY